LTNNPRVLTAGTHVRPDPVHWSRVANVMRRRAKREEEKKRRREEEKKRRREEEKKRRREEEKKRRREEEMRLSFGLQSP